MKRRTFLSRNLALGTVALWATEARSGTGLLSPVLPVSSYDVVIFGATPSGIVSAVRVARSGFRVLLVSAFEHIGGMMTNGLSIMDTLYDGNRSPLYAELLGMIQQYYKEKYGADSEEYKGTLFGSRTEPGSRPRYESGVLLKLFNQWIGKEKNITLLRQYEVAEVTRKNDRIDTVTFRSFRNEPVVTAGAPIFMDASYEGDLLARARVEYVVGRESRREFDEQHAGKIFALRGPGRFPFEGAEGLMNLRTFQVVSQQIFAGSTGEGDKAVQAYNPRFVLTNDPAKRIPIAKPEGYDRSVYLGITEDRKANYRKRYPVKADLLLQDVDSLGLGGLKLAGRKFGNNAANYTGMNWEYPDADWPKRRQIIKAHIDHGLGLFYFLQNDETVPEPVRRKTREFGLSNDEFTDNHHVPYEIYVREARRMRGRYVFTENDGSPAEGIDRTPVHADSIAMAEWPMDSHDCTTERKPGSLHDGIVLLAEKTRPSQIPYRCLLPKDLNNLLVTVCVSATHIGWGTIRVEPTLMHIAESMGWAAVLCLQRQVAPARLAVPLLQQKLVDEGIMLSFFNEFDMAVRDSWVPAVQFWGTQGLFPDYNARPDEPLRAREATLWITAFQQVLNGKNDAMAIARRLYALPTDATTTVTAADFLKSLALRPDGASAAERILTDAGIQPASAIKRKEACLVLYTLFKKMKSYA